MSLMNTLLGISETDNLHGSAALTNPLNYVTQNRFYVEIGSSIKASFSECSGSIGMKINTTSFNEGGVNDQKRILINQAEATGEVTLKRGITDDSTFWEWINAVLNGKSAQRMNVNILLFNQAGKTMQGWTLMGAIPVGWKLSGSLDASKNEVAVEELTLAYEYIKVAGSSTTSPVTGKLRGAKGYFEL